MNDIRERIANLTPQQRNLLNKYLLQKNLAPVDGLPIPRVDATEPSILSFSQERLWVLEQLEECGAAYHVTKLIRLNGILDRDILEKSLQDLTNRHQSLRTYFVYQDGTPMQVLNADRPFKLEELDLRGEDEETREKKARRIINQKVMHPFDLSKDFMLRATLIRLKDEEYILTLIMHHIASDGWSIGILCRDLSELYRANLLGQDPHLPPMPVQYVDFSNWQRESFSGKILEDHLAYWKDQLAGAPELLQLPTDYPRPSRQTFDGTSENLVLPSNLIKSVEGLSRKENVTLFMTLLSAFQTLLYRYSGSEDILVGSPIANRKKIETEEMIGFFVNTLVFRTDFSNNPTFRELLARVRNTCLGAYSHQDLPFELLVQELKPKRSLSHSSVFQVMFTLQNTPQFDIEFPELDVQPVDGSTKSSKFDITMSLKEIEGEWTARIEYNTQLFGKSTIQRMLNHYAVLLNSIVEDVDQKVSELPILASDERQQLLVEWNDTDADFSIDRTVCELFEDQASKTPTAIAVSYEKAQMTYAELNRRANQVAHYLRRVGVQREDLVTICTDRSNEMMVGVLGILKAGAAYIPLDPTYPKDRLEFMLHDAKARFIVTQEKMIDELPECDAKLICLDRDWAIIEKEPQENPAVEISENNVAYVIYTSGSTGKPKGVQIPHKALSNFLQTMVRQPGITADDILLAVTTLSFDIAGLELFCPIIVGGQVALVSREVASNGMLLAKELKDSKATIMQATPATWRLFLEIGKVPENLKMLCGGEAMPRDLANALLVNNNTLWNMYGPTETTIWSSICQVFPGKEPISIGRPIANTQMYVLDSSLNPVPVGVPGKLYIGGDGVALGYLFRPELTEERFVPDPFSGKPGARIYDTGDLVRYHADGQIEYFGRADFQVKVRGHRIELGEIEAILDTHSLIQSAVVVVREDTPGDKRIVAYLIADSNETVSSSELRDFLKKKLPDYMVPSQFVLLESFPLTPNGKVDRKALPATDYTSSSVEQSYVSPRNEMETRLASIWEKVLHMDRVGIHDNFFDIGGHSLLAVRLITIINREIGHQVPLASLFESPTIEQLAHYLENGSSSNDLPGSLVPLRKEGSLPPFFCIPDHHGFGIFFRHLANNLNSDQPVYALQLPGIYGEETPLDCIEDVASYFIDLIRQIQPYGPYYLGAYCFGRLVVFEMAQQLVAMGEEVGFLGIFDHAAPGFSMKPPRRERIRMHVDRLKELNGRGKVEYLNGVAKVLGQKINRKINGLKLSASQKELISAAKRASENYQPRPYPGQITFFRATKRFDSIDFWSPDPYLGWNTLALEGVKVRDVNGSLDSWFEEPEVGELAKELQSCLDEAYSVRLYI